MNMKKSIAGVMAGAMAVSAMAATVSADDRQTMSVTGSDRDAISLTYDLKTYVFDANATKPLVTVTARWENVAFTKADLEWHVETAWRAKAPGWGNAYGIEFGVDNGFINGIPEESDKDTTTYKDIYNKYQLWSDANATRKVNSCTIDDGKHSGDHYRGGMKEFEFTARPYKNLVANESAKDTTVKYTGKPDNTTGSIYSVELDRGMQKFFMPISVDGTGANKFKLTDKYSLKALGYSGTALEATGVKTANGATVTSTTINGSEVYAFETAVAKMTYEIPNKVKLNMTNAWSWSQPEAATVVSALGEDPYREVDMTAEIFSWGFWSVVGINKKNVIANTKAVLGDPQISVEGFTGGATSEKVFPFKTELKPSKNTVTGQMSNDVIAAITARKQGGNYYTRPIAVINDAIANHNNVTFTFYSYGGYVGTVAAHQYNQWIDVGRGLDYEAPYTWHNPTFGQHLYTNVQDKYSLFDSTEYDMYGSYSDAWGINLFTSALVVNQNITMQLSDTDMFEWGNNCVTFEWFDIIEDGRITDAKTFLSSMLLYTPVDWYWDRLELVVSDTEEETVETGEGLDGDGEVLGDEPDVDLPDDFGEEPADVDPEPEPEPEPVKPAPSPATGNAPVALAVIPVALAAAAVVAKKRG